MGCDQIRFLKHGRCSHPLSNKLFRSTLSQSYECPVILQYMPKNSHAQHAISIESSSNHSFLYNLQSLSLCSRKWITAATMSLRAGKNWWKSLRNGTMLPSLASMSSNSMKKRYNIVHCYLNSRFYTLKP